MGEDFDFGKCTAMLIDKETGKVTNLGDVTVRNINGAELTPGDVHIELRRPSFTGGYSFSARVKLRSKRKWRKFIYSLSRPNLMNCKYISKREMIRAIHKMSEEAKVGHIAESDEQLMRYSAKHLWAIANHLYGIIQSNV